MLKCYFVVFSLSLTLSSHQSSAYYLIIFFFFNLVIKPTTNNTNEISFRSHLANLPSYSEISQAPPHLPNSMSSINDFYHNVMYCRRIVNRIENLGNSDNHNNNNNNNNYQISKNNITITRSSDKNGQNPKNVQKVHVNDLTITRVVNKKK